MKGLSEQSKNETMSGVLVDLLKPLLLATRCHGRRADLLARRPPILRKHCTVCHSERNVHELEVSGGLVMDTYDAVLKNEEKAPGFRGQERALA